MYMQTNYGLVALDPTNGNILWQYKGANSKGKNAAGDIPTNGIGARAIAYGDGMIFGGQQDGSLVAVDSKSGAPVWTIDTEAAGSNAEGNVFGESNPWSIFDPSADTAWTKGSGLKQDLVFSAPNGGESPMRGHFDAFDAKTGVLAWRFWSTPDPTQLPFILTWGNPAEAATGGGACWSLPAVDNTLGLAYFGCGNHFPEDGSSPGKKLWTDAFFSVRLDTGALKWYFQTVHHDEWDYDVSNPPTRINPVINGKRYQVVAIGGKSGWEFVRNAVNGRPTPGFPAPETKVLDLNGGKGAALNLTWPTQPEPTGGAGQILPHCMTATQAAAMYPTFPNCAERHPDHSDVHVRNAVQRRLLHVVPGLQRRDQLVAERLQPVDERPLHLRQRLDGGLRELVGDQPEPVGDRDVQRWLRRDDLGPEHVDEQARLAGHASRRSSRLREALQCGTARAAAGI